MATQDAAIVVEGVHKYFGEVKALQGVDLVARPGKVFGLLGPNGAGKTTLVRILTSLLQPDKGRASVAGLDVVKDVGRLRENIGLAGQYAAVDSYLTGHENLEMVGRLYHLPRSVARKRADELLERFGLTDAANRTARTYSGGMRHRLDLAASLVGQPTVLFLDEPTTGLDPRTRLELWELIRELVRDGTTILLTTQYLEEADELADRIAVIDEGKIIAEGTSEELKAKIASDVLELKMAEGTDLQHVANLIQPVSNEAPQVDSGTNTVSIPVDEGVQSLLAAARLLDGANLEIVDLHLRRPSLDDVFLTLTGKSQSTESAA